MEDNKLKFVVRGRKDVDKFVLEGITNYILPVSKFIVFVGEGISNVTIMILPS